jgi:hypothetical protein
MSGKDIQAAHVAVLEAILEENERVQLKFPDGDWWQAECDALRAAIAALTASPQAAPGVLVRRDARGLIASVEVGGKTVATNPEYVLDDRPQAAPEGGDVSLRERLLRESEWIGHTQETRLLFREAASALLPASPQVQGVEASLRAALTRLLQVYDDSASEFEAADAAQQARDALAATPQRAPGVDALRIAGWQVVDDKACQRRMFAFRPDAEAFAAALPEPRIETLWSGYERPNDPTAALASGPSGADGWVLVPREPTPEMVDAGYLHTGYVGLPQDIYAAMLAAAPAAQDQGEG